MNIQKFKADLTLTDEGRWVELGEGAAIRVARAGNKRFQARIQELLRPHRTAIRTGTVADDLYLRLGKQAQSETILVDWKGFTDDAGAPLPYSPSAALKLLTAPEYADFARLVEDLASDEESYRKQYEEAAAKN